jgi:predicted ATPase/class 3 adenylate cyclase
LSDHDAAAGERRQLTVMFCDLVESTALAGRLDPEEFREVLSEYHASCAAVVARFDGYVAQYLGDGVLVYFGYPAAHEDDAHQAVRAGLGILEAITGLNTRLQRDHGVRVSVRLAIHTGLVVVGQVRLPGTNQQLALGDTLNLAARLQETAAPDTLVISAATAHLVEGFFICRELGPHRVRGVSAPVVVHQVVGESTTTSRLEAEGSDRLTPFVGRDQELSLILDRWARVRAGTGQVILLAGEPGIGKSRLVQIVKDRIREEPHNWLECRCSPHAQQSAMYPVIDLLGRLLHFDRADPPEVRLARLQANLEPCRESIPDAWPLLASLLSLPAPEGLTLPLMTPARQRQRTLETLRDMVLAIAGEQPVLLVAEDLHWIDPSSLELLDLLLADASKARLLVLLTFRTEFHPPWTPGPGTTLIELPRLSEAEVETMVARMARGKIMPAEAVGWLVAKTDGVPLFVEEMTKTILESGALAEDDRHYTLTRPLPTLAIPATLSDSLMARLDRLGTAKMVAQLGATLGRAFSYDALQAIAPLDERELHRELTRLVEAGLLNQRHRGSHVTYVFKHTLLQDAAYESLLRSNRRMYHAKIARTLAERSPETLETQPELLAHHYTEAGLVHDALGFWLRAARRSTERSANAEAISHITRGLELLGTLREPTERDSYELKLQVALGAPLIATRGYAAMEVERAFTRARELCQRLGDTPALFQVLWGMWAFVLVRGNFGAAQELNKQLLALAQRDAQPDQLLESHLASGITLYHTGEAGAARTHLEQCIGLYDEDRHRAHAFVFGQDPGMAARAYASHALWLLGYPSQALKRGEEALALAQRLAHPYSLIFALLSATWLHQFRREARLVRHRAEAELALVSDRSFQFGLGMGTIMRGWALAEEGNAVEGIADMTQGLDAWRRSGAELARPHFDTLLAEVHGRAGQAETGIRLADEALATARAAGEVYYEPEQLRVQGELLLRLPMPGWERAETKFREAVELARRRQTRSLELRASVSLGRLHLARGQRDRAREDIAPVYGWFAEGFDTPDLQEARALLEAPSL